MGCASSNDMPEEKKDLNQMATSKKCDINEDNKQDDNYKNNDILKEKKKYNSNNLNPLINIKFNKLHHVSNTPEPEKIKFPDSIKSKERKSQPSSQQKDENKKKKSEADRNSAIINNNLNLQNENLDKLNIKEESSEESDSIESYKKNNEAEKQMYVDDEKSINSSDLSSSSVNENNDNINNNNDNNTNLNNGK